MATKKVTHDMVSDYYVTNTSYSGYDMVVTCDFNIKGNKMHLVIGQLQTLTYSIFSHKAPVYILGNSNAIDYVTGYRTIAGTMIFTVFNEYWAVPIIDAYRKAYNIPASTKILMDEIPPLNFTVSMSNELGACSRLAIYGIRLYNEGQVMSINDTYTENQFQFVASDVDYLADMNAAIKDEANIKAAQSKAAAQKRAAAKAKAAQDESYRNLVQAVSPIPGDNKVYAVTTPEDTWDPTKVPSDYSMYQSYSEYLDALNIWHYNYQMSNRQRNVPLQDKINAYNQIQASYQSAIEKAKEHFGVS